MKNYYFFSVFSNGQLLHFAAAISYHIYGVYSVGIYSNECCGFLKYKQPMSVM